MLKSLVALRSVLTNCCTRRALIAPRLIRFAKALTALLAPHPELMPRSSADVTAMIFWPARDNARAVRSAKSLLLALTTDFLTP